MKKCLFAEAITDSRSWEKCSETGAFLSLLKHIYDTNHLKLGEVSAIPGVAGVFQVGNTIVKLFQPPEANLGHERFFQTELSAMNFCKNAGVLTPEIICSGIINDCVYSFPYTVMVCIDGVEADEVISSYDKIGKIEFSLKLKEITNKIHIPTNIEIPSYDDPTKMGNKLWNHMSEPFREDRMLHLAKTKFPEPVFQHGDLWDRNIFIDKLGRLVLIDFAESLVAPSYYDIGPIILNGGYDPVRLEAYWGDYKNDAFYDQFTTAWLLNWFGAIFIEWRANEMGIDFKSIASVNALRSMVIKSFETL